MVFATDTHDALRRAQVDVSGIHIGCRADATVHFTPYMSLTARCTDQHRPALLNTVRMASLGLAFTFWRVLF